MVAASSPELLGPADRKTLDRLVASSAGSVRGRVIVVDANGKVIADSAGPAELGASYADRPEITAAFERPQLPAGTPQRHAQRGHSRDRRTDSRARGDGWRGARDAERGGRQQRGAPLAGGDRAAGARRPRARRDRRSADRPPDRAPDRQARRGRRRGGGRRPRRPRPGGGHHRTALPGAQLQRDDRAGRPDARGPAGVRRRRVASAAHSAHGASAAARGAAGVASRRRRPGSCGGGPGRGGPALGDHRRAARSQPRRRARDARRADRPRRGGRSRPVALAARPRPRAGSASSGPRRARAGWCSARAPTSTGPSTRWSRTRSSTRRPADPRS